jgi:hypothetical protein
MMGTRFSGAGFMACDHLPDQGFAFANLRLSVLMDLYINSLYVLVSQILSSVLNSSALIHPLYHPLSTISTVGPTCLNIFMCDLVLKDLLRRI